MEAIAVDLAKDSVQSLLKSIVASIGKEIALARGFKDDLEDLQKKLTRLNYLLSGPESKNPVLRDWVNKVADVAYRAEDVVDEYAYEVLKRELALRDMASMEPLLRFKTRVRFFCFSRSSNPVLLRFRMAHEVKSLKESIAEIYADAQALGIKPVEVAAASSSSTDHTTATEMTLQWRREQVDNYEVLVGRDHIKAQIIQQLHQASNSPKRLSVIGVHGMPGIGKTKLCRSAFETTEVKRYFKERIWICISHDFDSQQLLKGMIEQLGEASTMSNIEAIKGKLQEKLEGKKYLLVLDDVWDTFVEAWEPLRNCLQDIGELKGNAILVTSRSREVLANLKAHSSDPTRPMDDPDIHELPRLQDTDSKSLFEKKVGNDLLDSTYKKELATMMLTKCGGVPLAIKTLAGLLRSKKDVHQWEEIEASSIWEEDAITLPASIKLTFKYLPSVALKKCFIYCAIFREDEIIEKDRLIQLWMAQGFLQRPDDEMEKVGEDYFHALLNNSLFQDAEFDNLGRVTSCKMHDAVHALARMLSRHDVTQEMRHLSLSESGDLGSMFKDGGKLRTFSVSYIPIKPDNFTLKTVNNLRVLSLVSVDLEELPDSIGELKHLRYLDISENAIGSLPDGFTRLCNLQTFRAGSEAPINLKFPMLPKGFTKLVKLRHMTDPRDCNDMGIPVGLGMLTCLRTLPVIDAGVGWGGRLSELQFLSKLEGRLIIKGLEQLEIEEAKKANLGEKKNIKDLGLYWLDNSCNKAMEVAEALQPHSNLASLKIFNYKAKSLPQWVTKMTGYGGSPFSNLVNLQILHVDGLEHLTISLKNLVALKELHIMSSDSVITLLHLECLVSLQILKMKHCSKMENLVADMTALVNLQKVMISYCTNMTCLPIGISNLLRLETLELGPFSPELDVFPFPTDNHDNYEDQNLNGCSQQSKTTTPVMIIKEGTIIKRKFESLMELSLCGHQMEKVKDLSNQIQHLSQLGSLRICQFNGLEALPEWLGNLTSLHRLQLVQLPNLKCLPSEAAMDRLSQLKLLYIDDCPLLKEACNRETGTEWSKIEHIPDLRIR